MYIYNLKTHTLHIEGYCRCTFKGMHYGDNYKRFYTEDDAIAYDGRSVSMCKNCQKKRDRLVMDQK